MYFHGTPKLFHSNSHGIRTLFPFSDAFQNNWRIPGPSGQTLSFLWTTSKEEGSGYTITSPILIVLLTQHSYSEA